MTTSTKSYDIDDIRMANRSAGFYFFEPATLRFFRSRIGQTVYQGPGGIYFTTSEQFIPSSGRPHPRRYTVRVFNPATGDVDTAGEFNELGRSAAVGTAKRLASGEASSD